MSVRFRIKVIVALAACESKPKTSIVIESYSQLEASPEVVGTPSRNQTPASVFCHLINPVSDSTHRHSLTLALTPGLVSAFFSVLYQALEEFLHLAPNQQFKELIVITVTSVGMLLAIEPILERIGPVRAGLSFKREDDVLIRAGAFLTIVATAFLHGLLHAHISESLSARGMVVLEQLLTALVAPTLITLSHGYTACGGIRRAGMA